MPPNPTIEQIMNAYNKGMTPQKFQRLKIHPFTKDEILGMLSGGKYLTIETFGEKATIDEIKEFIEPSPDERIRYERIRIAIPYRYILAGNIILIFIGIGIIILPRKKQ